MKKKELEGEIIIKTRMTYRAAVECPHKHLVDFTFSEIPVRALLSERLRFLVVDVSGVWETC